VPSHSSARSAQLDCQAAMHASTWSRLLAVLGVLLACSVWVTAPLLFLNTMGENFSEDPAIRAQVAASRHFWQIVLLTSWLVGLVGSSAIAGYTFRTNRFFAAATWIALSAFVVFAVIWGS